MLTPLQSFRRPHLPVQPRDLRGAPPRAGRHILRVCEASGGGTAISWKSLDKRLQRPIIGRGLSEPGALGLALDRRLDKAHAAKAFELAPHTIGPVVRAEKGGRGPDSAGTRRARVRVQPQPNAPLLIRLVRSPYGLMVGRPRRRSHGDLGVERGLQGPRVAEMVRESVPRAPISSILAEERVVLGGDDCGRGLGAVPYRPKRPTPGSTLVPRPRRYPEDP